jgi:hypothetical protein
MALVVALGLNLWVVVVALPLALAAHGDALVGRSALWLTVAALLPLAALALGAWRRSPMALMVAFPTLALLPQALAPPEVSARVLPPAASLLAAASLVGFLVAVARAGATIERAHDNEATLTRRLAQEPTPSRWRRRLRVYRGFIAISVLFPTVLVGGLELWPGFTRALEASFAAQAARAQALVTVLLGLLWVALARVYVLGPLHAHLQHDRDLLATMENDRRHARRGRPRPIFYLAVAIALGGMVAVVWQRSGAK